MSWKSELRAHLMWAARNIEADERLAEETDDERREELARAAGTAARVFRFARTELHRLELAVSLDVTGTGHRLSVADAFLETGLMANGLAMKVGRESGIVDLLHVEGGSVVDGQRRAIGAFEPYFGKLVVDLVTHAAGGHVSARA